MYAVAMPVTALVTPGPGGHQRHADLLRRARIAVGRVDGALLVAHEDVLDLVLLEQLVVDVEDRAARIAEDVLDALFLEAADEDFRARQLHDHASCRECARRAVGGERSLETAGRTRVERAPARLDRVESRDWGNRPTPGSSLALVAPRRECNGLCCSTASGSRPGSRTLPVNAARGQAAVAACNIASRAHRRTSRIRL